MVTAANVDVVVGADTSGLERGMTRANSRVADFARSGARVLSGFTGAVAGVGVLATRTAIQWEASFADVRKTVSGTDEELAYLEETLRNMATSGATGALEDAHTQLALIASLGGQLGVATSDLDEFTQTISAMTVATNMGAEDAANFAARFANVTGLNIATDIDNLADTVVTLGNNLAASESEIAAFAGRMSGLATMGFDPKDILAYSGAMASLGISSELGATNFTKSIGEMISVASGADPAKLQVWANVAGETADEFAELALADPQAAFQDFLEGLGELSADERLKVFEDLGMNSIEQQQVLTKLAGGIDTVQQALELADGAWEGNNALMDEARAKAETTAGQIQLLKNNLNEAAIGLGERFAPAVGDLAEGMAKVVAGDWVNGLNDMGGAARVLVDNFFQLFGVDLSTIPGIVEGLAAQVGTIVNLAIETGIKNITGLGEAFAAMVTIAVNQGISNITGLGEAFAAMLRSGWDSAIESIATGNFAQQVSDFFYNVISGAIQGIPTALSQLDDILGQIISALFGGGESAPPAAQNAGQQIGSTVAQGVVTGFTASDVVAGLGAALLGILNGIATAVSDAMPGFTSVMAERIGAGLSGIGRGIQTFVVDPITQGLSVAFDNIKRGFDRFFIEMQLGIVEWVMGFRQTILDMTGGNFDIAPNMNVNLDNLRVQEGMMNVGDMITEQLQTQMATGSLDLSGLDVGAFGGGITGIENLINFGTPEQLAQGFGAEARATITDALTMAIQQGDQGAIEVLTPLANQLEIDVAQIQADLQALASAQSYDLTVTANMNVLAGQVNMPPIAASAPGFGAGSGVPAFAGGGMFDAPNGRNAGFALLHDREMVLTPEQQRALAGSRTSGGMVTVNAYGRNPYEVLEMTQRASRDRGYE